MQSHLIVNMIINLLKKKIKQNTPDRIHFFIYFFLFFIEELSDILLHYYWCIFQTIKILTLIR